MRRLKKIVTAMLAAAVLVSGAAVPMEAQAASTLEKSLIWDGSHGFYFPLFFRYG